MDSKIPVPIRRSYSRSPSPELRPRSQIPSPKTPSSPTTPRSPRSPLARASPPGASNGSNGKGANSMIRSNVSPVRSNLRERSTATMLNVPTKPKQTSEKIPQKQQAKISLRETIALARASKRNETGSSDPDDPFANITNPFNLKVASEDEKSIEEEIEKGRTRGRLHLANRNLREIPESVYRMYFNVKVEVDFSKDTPAWYNSIDLSYFNAAANEIENIEEELAETFPNLKTLDLHGNRLRTLPENLGNLRYLTSLDLSKNRLRNDSLERMQDLEMLSDLNLECNELSGNFLDLKMPKLTRLCLDSNELTSLPTLSNMTSLSQLSVAKNKLTHCELELISQTLVELNLSGNSLASTLISSPIKSFPQLQILELGQNHLQQIASHDISFPQLHRLVLMDNSLVNLFTTLRLSPKLVSLLLAQNRLQDFPDGLTDLQNLRFLDISHNLVEGLPPRLGEMEELESFQWNGNRIFERSWAGMDTFELKRFLRGRLGRKEMCKSPIRTRTNAVLDYSNKNMEIITSDILEQSPSTLLLQQNCFQAIPLNISEAGMTLKTLDISRNCLSENWLPGKIELPALENLSVMGNRIFSLENLMANLVAPQLMSLDVSCNELTELPINLSLFSQLRVLNASDNRIGRINVQTFSVLERINLSNNAIEEIPAELGLKEHIRDLQLYGNLFHRPRYDDLSKGTPAVLEYLRKLNQAI